MRFVAAGAVVAASLACGTAFAAEVRLEGVADADAQAIARGVEAHLNALEARGLPIAITGPGMVRPGANGAYELVLPPFTIDTPEGLRFDFAVSHVDVARRGPHLYDFEVKPLLPVEIRFDGALAATIVVGAQAYRGRWDARMGAPTESTATFGDIRVEGRNGHRFAARIADVDAREATALSADGTSIDHTARIDWRGLAFDDGDGATATVEGGTFDIELEGLPLPSVAGHPIVGLQGVLFGSAENRGARFLARLQADGPRERLSVDVRRIHLRAVAGVMRAGRMASVEALDGGLTYRFEIDDLAMTDGFGAPFFSLGRFETRATASSIRDTAVDTDHGISIGDFVLSGPFAGLVPGAADIDVGARSIPLAALIDEVARLSPTAGDTAATAMTALLGVLARSGTTLSLDRLDLRDGGITARLEAPVGYDIASLRFITEENRIAVRGLGAAVAALSANAGENAQLIGMLSFAMAMGRPEVRDDETVHVYAFGNGPNGGITLNGRSLGGAP